MGTVHILPVITCLDIPAERVLASAIAERVEKVVVLGYTEDGEEYFASSIAGGPEALWLLERLKRRLLKVGEGEG